MPVRLPLAKARYCAEKTHHSSTVKRAQDKSANVPRDDEKAHGHEFDVAPAKSFPLQIHARLELVRQSQFANYHESAVSAFACSQRVCISSREVPSRLFP